ncbi:triose-phosphate isomerase [Parvularcula sp. LCG005]|uniref:triose-phosphate isomerase n=1 Tax=Parvularcula sp. LCG005 TaxID=3078805 RepID=UPI0029424CDD|nr:triose-phosphate isomerase [Parvularcula sp. LCG005]WOI52077.1 triose-phosphate isomerase [Parvularcula sp. LCG005]
MLRHVTSVTIIIGGVDAVVKRLIAGNWKMFGLRSACNELEKLQNMMTPRDAERADVLICPPPTLLTTLTDRYGEGPILFGGQDCHPLEYGAFTGDVSAEQLKDAGATHCIVGHSERRQGYSETNTLVRRKAEAAHRAGLVPIVCVGETRGERVVCQASQVVIAQIEASMPTTSGEVVVAYEPIWAVGTGVIPDNETLEEMLSAIRETVGGDRRILYGGSVKPHNAAHIFSVPQVNGALIGGASLKAEDFYGIIAA